jgi:hypothetical protein
MPKERGPTGGARPGAGRKQEALKIHRLQGCGVWETLNGQQVGLGRLGHVEIKSRDTFLLVLEDGTTLRVVMDHVPPKTQEQE